MLAVFAPSRSGISLVLTGDYEPYFSHLSVHDGSSQTQSNGNVGSAASALRRCKLKWHKHNGINWRKTLSQEIMGKIRHCDSNKVIATSPVAAPNSTTVPKYNFYAGPAANLFVYQNWYNEIELWPKLWLLICLREKADKIGSLVSALFVIISPSSPDQVSSPNLGGRD